MVTRSDVSTLIPEEDAREILSILPQTSAALALCRTIRMSTKVRTQPVLQALPVAYWVNGDTGLKQTTDMLWGGVSMTAEELAVIVPIPEAVIDDAGYPIMSEIRPFLAAAIGQKLDAAVLASVERPPTWPEGLIPAATAAGNVHLASATPDEGGFANDLDLTMQLVEDDGYDVSGIAAKRRVKGLLRRSRDTTGQRLLDVQQSSIEGSPISYVPAGSFPAAADAIVGDFSLAVVGVRQDITYKLLDQAVITDDTGAVILNLAQQDAVAMRVVARFGYSVAAPISRREPGETGTAFPFAVTTNA